MRDKNDVPHVGPLLTPPGMSLVSLRGLLALSQCFLQSGCCLRGRFASLEPLAMFERYLVVHGGHELDQDPCVACRNRGSNFVELDSEPVERRQRAVVALGIAPILSHGFPGADVA